MKRREASKGGGGSGGGDGSGVGDSERRSRGQGGRGHTEESSDDEVHSVGARRYIVSLTHSLFFLVPSEIERNYSP